MCPNEVIYRLLDLISIAINKIEDEATLEQIIKELDDIKILLNKVGN